MEVENGVASSMYTKSFFFQLVKKLQSKGQKIFKGCIYSPVHITKEIYYNLWIMCLPLFLPFLRPSFWSVVCVQQPIDGPGPLRVWQTLGQDEAFAALHGGEACQCSDVEVRVHTYTIFVNDLFHCALLPVCAEVLCIKQALISCALIACVN